MVVLAASVVTKAGKPLISRQFLEIPKSRIESLLTSFPKLIPTNSQHTSVETAEVRYVYQPLEELYVLLITTKGSNILQDIDTLHIVARVVADLCRTINEREIARQAFELLGAFDEIVSLGWREQINLMQVKNNLEMESHEEKIQEIIARNKEAEAKEELKRRAKQLEMQRREQQKRASSGGGMSSPSFLSSGGYSSVPRFDAPTPPTSVSRTESPAPSSLRAPAFKGSGMKLGSKKKTGADLVSNIIGDEPEGLIITPPASTGLQAQAQDRADNLPVVVRESVHVDIREQLTVTLLREGGLKTLEAKGDLNLSISDAQFSRIRLGLSSPASSANDLVFKQHPNVGKFQINERIIALKDANRAFPVGQPLSVLKWRYSGRDESLLPLSINVWPTPSGDGTCEVNIEYELENSKLTLHDLTIVIPLPSGSYPTITPGHAGQWSLNAASHSLQWTVPRVSALPAEDGTPGQTSGSMEFSVGGEEVDAFFPVKVSFVGLSSLLAIEVNKITRTDSDDPILFSQEAALTVEDFVVV